MRLPLLRSSFTVLALALSLPAPAPAKTFRNFDIPCLAPLLRDLDPEAPANIEQAFLAGPVRAAVPLEGLGEVSFPITTSSPEAQRFFNQGLALLHGLWYREAERSFRQALFHDPGNPMTLWGLAQANELRPGRARLFIETARRSIRPGTTPRERAWIDLLARYHGVHPGAPPAGPGSADSVELRRIRDLESLTLSQPDDLDAKAFLLRHLALEPWRAGLPLTSRLSVDSLAREIEAAAPAHPSRHYRVFLWLDERPELSLAPAAAAPSLSPGIADSWRYAALAYLANGRDAAAIPFLEAALRVDYRYLRDQRFLPADAQTLASNSASLAGTLAGLGRIDPALARAREMVSLPRATLAIASDEAYAAARSSSFQLGKKLTVETLLRAEAPERLLDLLENDPLFEPLRVPGDRARWLYDRALALASLDRVPETEPLDDELAALAGASALAAERDEIEQLRDALAVTRDLLAGALPDENLSLEPPRFPAESLARARAKAGLTSESLAHIAAERERRPGSLLAAGAYAELHFASGDKVRAMQAFDRAFRREASRADRSLAVFDRLAPLAAEMKLRTRWILPAPAAEIPGAPANLDSLGPPHWSPPPAPFFSLPNHVGRKVSLSDFRGDAVLVNFFLGVGCVYCAEQLTLFRPHLDAFAEAGVAFVAVSNDGVADLAQAFGETEEKDPEAREAFPYPVLADPSLGTFKTYGAFDDFEEGAMHGTFLIDTRGRLLWRNVSHAPFNEPLALLEEARRLLRAHDPQTER